MNQNIFRVCKDKENPYVMLNKGFLNNKKLSLKAKGLLSYLLSRPDDWKIYELELVTHHKDGRDSLRAGIAELIENGYITREKIRNERGQLKGCRYSVYECPNHSGFSTLGKPTLGEPTNGKPDTTNNNQTNKEINNLPIIPPLTPPPKKGIELPDWLPKEDWDAFVAYRKEAKAPLGPVGMSRAINCLSELRRQGENISAVINQSIVNGWKGLFKVNAQRSYGQRKQVCGEGGLVA